MKNIIEHLKKCQRLTYSQILQTKATERDPKRNTTSKPWCKNNTLQSDLVISPRMLSACDGPRRGWQDHNVHLLSRQVGSRRIQIPRVSIDVPSFVARKRWDRKQKQTSKSFYTFYIRDWRSIRSILLEEDDSSSNARPLRMFPSFSSSAARVQDFAIICQAHVGLWIMISSQKAWMERHF